jgi:ubiquinone/menaquinone biosynthesis C-methylase UbiE
MNCDRIANVYRWIEYAVFGGALQRRRTAFLGDVSQSRKVLALGDGDGRALVRLLACAPRAHITYVDASAQMLRLARDRVAAQGTASDMQRIVFLHADARALNLEERVYDLIVTHFFLDCFHEQDLRLVVEKIARAAAPEAHWIVSEFRPAHRFAKILIPIMYAFFAYAANLQTRRLVDHHPHLLTEHFQMARAQYALGGLLASELWVRPG